MPTLQENLTLMATRLRELNVNRKTVYCCFEEFVTKWGQEYLASALPVEYEMGIPRHCFHNSLELTWEHEDLVYVEGYALLADIPFPIHHAWCVRQGSNKVIDVTTTNFVDYFGVPFRRDYVLGRESEYPSLLDDWGNEFPLMQMSDEEVHKVLYIPANGKEQ